MWRGGALALVLVACGTRDEGARHAPPSTPRASDAGIVAEVISPPWLPLVELRDVERIAFTRPGIAWIFASSSANAVSSPGGG